MLIPIDRAIMALVWSERGYPAGGAYRDYHGLTFHHHRLWSNDGSTYDRQRATAQLRFDARDFVERVKARVAKGGLCVCALDTELLGHWWYEGVRWLMAVIEEAARQGLPLSTLDDASLQRHEPAQTPPDLPITSWGEGGDVRTWSGPPVAELAWRARRAELAMASSRSTPPDRALRELLALQSSDWAFMSYRELAGDYPRLRASGHLGALNEALQPSSGSQSSELRNLAPELSGWS